MQKIISSMCTNHYKIFIYIDEHNFFMQPAQKLSTLLCGLTVVKGNIHKNFIYILCNITT